MPCDDHDGSAGCDGRRKKIVLMVLMMLLVEAMAPAGAMAVPPTEVGEGAVVIGSDGSDGSSKLRLLPAHACSLLRPFFISADAVAWEAASCLFPTQWS